MVLKRSAIQSLVDRAAEIDRWSVVSKRYILTTIEGKVSRMRSVQRDNAVYALDQGRLSRRDFLKVLGLAGVGAVAGAKALQLVDGLDAPIGYASGESGDFETIEVAAGDTFAKNMSEGETWGNVVIDISASGADYQISTQGNSCTIQNVGIRGVWDSHDSSPFHAYCGSGDVLIENVYIGDGSTATQYPNGNSGVWVAPSHAGKVTIRNLHYADNPSNAVYGSAPGNPSNHPSPGNDGGMVIEDSFSRNHASGFRIGTDGSKVRNCVAVDGGRGGWAYYNDCEFIDCDFGGNRDDIQAGNGNWGDDGVATMTNCRYETVDEDGNGRVVGESVGTPQRTEPSEVKGVPLTPEEAASGASSGRDASGLGGGNDEDNSGKKLEPC